MSDFRVRYGSAMGPYGTAAITSANMVFTSGDTTPDVTNGTFFITGNTSATVITYFDVLEGGGNVSTQHNGKFINVLVQDNNTTFANGGQLFLSGTGGAATSGQNIEFVYFNSGWFERGGSQAAGRDAVKSVTFTAANAAIDVTNVKVLIVSNTGGGNIAGFSGGALGQIITVGKAVAAVGSVITITGAANLMLAGTTAFTMNGSAFYQFVSDNGSRFRQIGPAALP